MTRETGKTAWRSYDWLEIGEPDNYDQLEKILDIEFNPRTIIKQLKENISDEVNFILVEHDYVDKDYRSTFYNFYAKKGHPYRNDCVRLHFFDKDVRYNEAHLELSSADGRLEDHYFGYIVLRPTIVATLGRSILSPRIRVGAQGQAIQSSHHVHILGYTLFVRGFPSMAQHTDIAVCAHVSCWAILRHYSESYSQHRELLVHDITRLAKPFDPGGLTPSLGLTVYEAERIFQAAGCFPLVVVKQGDKDLSFYAQLLGYLESGFPLFVAMEDMEDEGHAIVVSGYSWRKAPTRSTQCNSHVWSQVETLLAVDDNHFPYSIVSLRPDSLPSSNPVTYTAQDFFAFIVPLPEKIFYPAQAIDTFSSRAMYRLYRDILDLSEEEILLRRYFITTVSALRRFAREKQSQMGDILVNLLMRLKTAQFVWVVEYATEKEWGQNHITARAVVDATASPNDEQPMWLLHNHELAIVFDRSSGKPIGRKIALERPNNTPLPRMEQNLRPVMA